MNHLRAKILLNINLLYFFFMLSAKDETSILLSFDRYRSYLLPELQEHLVHFVEPQRLFPLFQLPEKPESYA